MPYTTNYSIPIPTIGGDGDNWGNILNNSTFGQFDSILYGVQNSNISNSPPATLAAGTIWIDNTAAPWQYQVYDGTEWVLIGTIDPVTHVFIAANTLTPNKVVFTASGTYTPSADLVYAVLECVGGGGGGSSGGAPSFPLPVTPWIIGSGGGSGGYSKITLQAASIVGDQVITIGAGGAGGAQPANSTPLAGVNGGVTSIGSLLTANGGNGATVYIDTGSRFIMTIPGAGATLTTGDLVIPGANGNPGTNIPVNLTAGLVTTSGNGGSSVFGGGGLGVVSAHNSVITGNAGLVNSGSGGSGGSFPVQTLAPFGTAGGAGADGIVIITEYIG